MLKNLFWNAFKLNVFAAPTFEFATYLVYSATVKGRLTHRVYFE